MKKIYSIFLFMLVCFLANAQTVNLTPSKDNAIYSESGNSSGAGYIFSGSSCNGFFRRALMEFDLSSIPTNAIVSSVTLTMNINQTGASGTQVYRIYA
ncbi:MAG: hypothetical protein AB8B56_04910, partial [Crocinitomicaceae bacterium]